jgi:hypothetical protein
MLWLQVWRPRTSHRTPGVRSSHRHPGGVPPLRLRSPSPAYALTSSSICICISYSRGDGGDGMDRQSWLLDRTSCSVLSRHDRLTRFFTLRSPAWFWTSLSWTDIHTLHIFHFMIFLTIGLRETVQSVRARMSVVAAMYHRCVVLVSSAPHRTFHSLSFSTITTITP